MTQRINKPIKQPNELITIPTTKQPTNQQTKQPTNQQAKQ